jgi:hypothetical protein
MIRAQAWVRIRVTIRVRVMVARAIAMAVALLALVSASGASFGCAAGDAGSSPEAAVLHLIASARSGDRTAVYQRLGPRTRGRIEEILAAARKSGGARLLRPEDLVTVGWVPPAWEASGVHELARKGLEADVEVVSAAGDRQTMHVVREGKRWMVELPLR